MNSIRSRIFREVVTNPLYKNDLNISTEYLDPLMGINSIELAVKESASGSAASSPEQVGLGSDPNGMWTPYQWLHLMFSEAKIKSGSTVVDVGAGIGRLGIYLREFRPDLHYIGLELLPSRVEAARNLGLDVWEWDLSRKELPLAACYYYYNALPRPAYKRMIKRLKEFCERKEEFLLVSARDPYGRFRTFLSPVKEIPISYPMEHSFIIYTNAPEEVEDA